MKPMIWHPEEQDQKVNLYLDEMNRAPYAGIFAMLLVLFCVFSVAILIASF